MRLLPRRTFNPAVLGRLLMGLEGMIEYAHHVNYVFPTYYNPVTHEPLPYFEHPELGCVREPWTVGSHAYVMMRAAEVTGDQRYQLEAARAFEHFWTRCGTRNRISTTNAPTMIPWRCHRPT